LLVKFLVLFSLIRFYIAVSPSIPPHFRAEWNNARSTTTVQLLEKSAVTAHYLANLLHVDCLLRIGSLLATQPPGTTVLTYRAEQRAASVALAQGFSEPGSVITFGSSIGGALPLRAYDKWIF
jgi:hypothetical protein